MGSVISTLLFAVKLVRAIGEYMIFGWSNEAYRGDAMNSEKPLSALPQFLSNPTIVGALSKFMKKTGTLTKLSDDALVKITRQLDHFCSNESGVDENEIIALAGFLVDQSVWYQPLVDRSVVVSPYSTVFKSKVPKVRFGKTELDISIVTCGGMRLQNSWLPDNIPFVSPNRNYVLRSPPQKNIKDCIRYCLALGINHFETARMYGTSEYQMTEALYELMEEGEIQRKDFIFQTKIFCADKKTFMKSWDATWSNVREKLGYVDLLALHAIADVNTKLADCIAICNDLKQQGKIRNLGFSTHGSSEQIMNLINTEYVSGYQSVGNSFKVHRVFYLSNRQEMLTRWTSLTLRYQFDYINIHEHYFGSYHGSGTPDTVGGQGNLACVKRALELDMGVFQISPVDKGGRLYHPSKDVISLVGRDLTPIAFALLFGWKTIGFHTSSVGVARPSDLDEVLNAARMYALSTSNDAFNKAVDRLNERAVATLGTEWVEKGLMNVPSFMDESTDGIAVGHILWLYNLLTSYGMYDFCHERYQSLVNASWDKKKSFQENANAM